MGYRFVRMGYSNNFLDPNFAVVILNTNKTKNRSYLICIYLEFKPK